MKLIKLTQGKYAQVDDDDYEELSKYKWHAIKQHINKYYALGKKGVRMHRMILQITDSNTDVDHIDGDGLNNQRNNIRIATGSQNMMNRIKINKATSSIYKGVSYDNNPLKCKKWRVRCAINKIAYTRLCNTEIEAAATYNVLASILHKEFAVLNDTVYKLKHEDEQKVIDYVNNKINNTKHYIKSIKIMTPAGQFESYRKAAQYYKTNHHKIRMKVESDKYLDYFVIKNENTNETEYTKDMGKPL